MRAQAPFQHSWSSLLLWMRVTPFPILFHSFQESWNIDVKSVRPEGCRRTWLSRKMMRLMKMILRLAPLCFVLCLGGSAFAGLISNGLVARYQFEGTLTDSAGQADGTAVGNPTFGSSPVSSQSLQVSGGNYAQVNNGFVPGMSSFTISTWFRVEDFPRRLCSASADIHHARRRL